MKNMSHRLAVSLFAVLWMINLAGAANAAEQSREILDPFLFDGARNILEEKDFGIVNGMLTAGIPYKNVFSVSGLWAPPYVSSDFKLSISLIGQPILTECYTWRPFYVERVGLNQGIAVETVTMLIPGTRTGLVEIALKNLTTEQRQVPVAITVSGTLDTAASPVDPASSGAMGWSFLAPQSKTATTRRVIGGALHLEQGSLAIVLRASGGTEWQDSQPCGRCSISLPPSGIAKLYVVFAVGPSAEATAACERIAMNPEQAMAGTRTAYAKRVEECFQKLPRLESSNPALDKFYSRSLVSLAMMNRWDVPEFVLHPYYSLGSVKGGCVGSYLWDQGEIWEIFPLFDPESSRTHLKQFLANDMTKHFAFDPIGGRGYGPLYPVNQEKIVGLIYYYVKNTGDMKFLNEVVDGKTVLEHAILNAMYGDDPTKPVNLIDYGPAGDHIELRLGIPYNHVKPDLNGRRYETYMLAAELADVAGKPAPYLRQRAEDLKTVLKRRLWNEKARWFNFEDDKGHKNIRYTDQMFYLFGSNVLDAEEEAGLLSHCNSEKEFLSEFGHHSMSKTDIAYDQVDIDCGGGGAYVSFPTHIAEKLYRAGHPAAAENILKRILWWGDHMPYWGDSLVANRIDYRKDTPLQNTIDSAAAAQCVIFGMFGVRAEFNGDIRINPHMVALAPKIALKGLRLRGHVLDIVVDGGEYEVREGDNHIRATVGQPILVQGDKLLIIDAL